MQFVLAADGSEWDLDSKTIKNVTVLAVLRFRCQVKELADQRPYEATEQLRYNRHHRFVKRLDHLTITDSENYNFK